MISEHDDTKEAAAVLHGQAGRKDAPLHGGYQLSAVGSITEREALSTAAPPQR